MLEFKPSLVPGVEEYAIDIKNSEFRQPSGVVDEAGHEMTNMDFMDSLAEYYGARVCLVPARCEESRLHNSGLTRSNADPAQKAANMVFTILLQRPANTS